MRHPALVACALVSALSSRPATAATDCPDGDWFCDPAPIDPAPLDGPAEPPPSGEPPAASPAEPPPPALPRRERREREIRIDVERVKPAQRRRQRYREWGINMHATIGLMADDDAARDAGMNGVGAALRFRPIPHIAIEGSLELVWGVDYNGFDRFEHAFLANALFFANPRSAVQLYGLAGLGVSGAYLDSSDENGLRTLRDERYSYVGAQLGFGVEARLTRNFAFGGDLIGLVRERSDRHADDNPEFIDPDTHRTTNASGGGLVRLGATYYW